MDFRVFLSKGGIILATQICILTLLSFLFFFFKYDCGKTDFCSHQAKKKKPKPKKYKISNHTLLFRLIFFNNFIYLFIMAALGLHCCASCLSLC